MICTKCKVDKAIIEFPTHKGRYTRQYKANEKAASPTTYKLYKRDAEYRRLYGISLVKYNRIKIKQDNKCAICKEVTENLQIDHDHKTGNIRGLLCVSCNRGLGQFKDSIEKLVMAIEYLSRSINKFDDERQLKLVNL